jgi:hypothetical protein
MAFEGDIGFERRMRGPVERVYQTYFPGCQVKYTREHDELRPFDDHFAIDTVLELRNGGIVTAQQKCRRYRYFLQYRDFTQEYMNAVGSTYESRGEWFHLASQIYFYGWANQEENGLVAWLILDVVKYKALVERKGGLENIGTLRQNKDHGSASFYTIPTQILRPAFIGSHGI